MSNEFGLSKIGQISVPVKDLDRAVSFYKDTLGMKHLFSVPNMAFFDCAGVRLMVCTSEGLDSGHYASVIYYKVDDIDVAYSELIDLGVSFDGEPHMIADMGNHELWMAFFKDVDDNILALMSEVPK